jgi:hypothetical protein
VYYNDILPSAEESGSRERLQEKERGGEQMLSTSGSARITH